jgi:hypothetical protein
MFHPSIHPHFRTRMLVLIMLVGSKMAVAQENMLTIGGGYAFANVQDTDLGSSGWRINALFDFNPGGGSIAHGVSVGYVNTNANVTGAQNAEYKLTSVPIYYAPKMMFGKKNLRAFVQGAIGMHFSSFKRSGSLGELSSGGGGFYGGLSAGGMLFISEQVFLNAEYEFAYLSSSYYKDGFLNSAMLGFGFRF